jgi:cytochrome c-type biogenesis protein CcmH
LLAAADHAPGQKADAADDARRLRIRRVTAVIALLALPLGAGLLYAALGSPNLPGQPLAARVADNGAEQSIAEMLARIESHLEQNPGDGRGWEVVAPVYLRLERFDDAIKARRNALRLLGATAERESALGEALAASANGIITAEAKAAFERGRALDGKDVKSQFYLGLAAEQDGRPDEAARMWRGLIAQGPPDAPWLGFVHAALARVDKSGTEPGPSTDDLSAAAAMTPEQRVQMVRGMVERLAARLHEDGSDVEGWLRLVRAYMVLGEREKAKGTAGEARRVLATEPDKLRRLDDGVKELGVEG